MAEERPRQEFADCDSTRAVRLSEICRRTTLQECCDVYKGSGFRFVAVAPRWPQRLRAERKSWRRWTIIMTFGYAVVLSSFNAPILVPRLLSEIRPRKPSKELVPLDLSSKELVRDTSVVLLRPRPSIRPITHLSLSETSGATESVECSTKIFVSCGKNHKRELTTECPNDEKTPPIKNEEKNEII